MDRAVVEFYLTRKGFQQAGLSSTVSANQADPFSRIELEVGMIEQRMQAISQ